MQTVLLRIGALMREEPGFWQSVKESFRKHPKSGPLFVGKMEGDRFRMHREIRYRNSFLPQVRGCVKSAPVGTVVRITMYLHPFVGAFMLIWLGAIGAGASAALKTEGGGTLGTIIPVGMFLFGLALMIGGFYPEAFKARRLLEEGIRGGGA